MSDREEKTKIFIPGHASGQEDETKIFAKDADVKDEEKEKAKPMTPEEASAAFVRHTQEEKKKKTESGEKEATEEHSSKPPEKPEYVFCMECGTKNRAGSKFCIHCGKPLFQSDVGERSWEGADKGPKEKKRDPGTEDAGAPETIEAEKLKSETDSSGNVCGEMTEPSPQGIYHTDPQPSQSGYNNGPEPLQNVYSSGPQPSQNVNGNGPQPSQNTYSDGPRPSQGYYQNESGTTQGYYHDGPRPSQNIYYSGGAYPGSGRSTILPDNIVKLICTAFICVSVLLALFGHVAHQGAVMSLGSSALSSFLPNNLSEFEDEFGGDDASSYQNMSKTYNQFRKMVNILAKDGYSSIDFMQIEHLTASVFGTLTDAMEAENTSGDSDTAAAISTMRKAERSGTAGFIIELVLIVALAAFSAYSIYIVFTSQSTAKRRGVFCILGVLDVVFLILHLVSISTMNSAFKRLVTALVGSSGYSGYFSGSSFKLFESSVGMLLLPLIFTVLLVVFDVVLENMNRQKTY